MRLLFVLLTGFALTAHGQSPFLRDVWISEPGNPVKTNGLFLDTAGLMWLATDAGLYTFNGRDITRAMDSIRAVTTVAGDKEQVLYGCRDGAVFRWQHTRHQQLLGARAAISAITPTPWGWLIGTQGDGAYCIAASGIRHLTSMNGLPDDYIYSIAVTGQGVVFGTDLGFFEAFVHPLHGLRYRRANTYNDIGRVVRVDRRRQWFGFAEQGILVDSAGGMPGQKRLTDGIGAVTDILPAGNRSWVTTDNGWVMQAVWKKDSLVLRPVLQTGKKINAVAADATGNIWLATSQGLTMITEQYLQQYPHTGFSLKLLGAMTGDGRGNLFYTQGDRLLQWTLASGRTEQVYRAPAPINCLFTDRQQRCWIGTSGYGVLCRRADGTVQPVINVAALQGAHVLSITGRERTLWVASLNGVEEVLLDQSGHIISSRHHGKHSGIGSDYVYHIFIDHRGRVWLATDGAGLAMYNGKRFERWDKQRGFSTDVVYSVTEDAAGHIWAATLNDGLFRYDGSRWQGIGIRDGLQDGTVFTLAANSTGQVVAVTGRGIDIWYPQDQEFRHLNRRSGLGLDSVSNALNAAAADTAGNIYLPYARGILLLKNQPASVHILPRVVLRQISLFFRVLDTPVHTFTHDQNHLSFRFEGINFAQPDRLRYRYRLEGFNNDWTETSDNQITYTRLPPGKYQFCVQATLHNSFDRKAWAAFAFTIEAPFWWRWWFWVLLLLVTAGIIYTLVRWRVSSLQRVARLQHERMVFEYEHLKSQVNPHFLFNSLNTLVNLIEESPDRAVTYTVQLSDLYRDTLSFHELDLVPLAEEWAVLERYLYIQRSRFEEALQLRARVDEAIRQQKKIIPLALQLLVENAIKHNVVSRSSPLIIYIEADEQQVVVRNAIVPKTGPEKGTGLGLSNIRQRYARITRRPVQCQIINNEFIIILPLL